MSSFHTMPGSPLRPTMTEYPLFYELFDDASLFPPGSSPMRQAVRHHFEHRRSPHTYLLGNFSCPAARLRELRDALTPLGHRRTRGGETGRRVDVGLTAPGGIAELRGAMEFIEHEPTFRLRAVELAAATTQLSNVIPELRELVPGNVSVYLEIPLTELDGEHCAAVVSAGCRIKLRTGGLSADAFPGASELGRALRSTVRSGALFKCTAGLHHATAYRDDRTGYEHHGFLNVALAVHGLQTRTADPAELLTIRDSEDIAGRVGRLSEFEVAQIRSQLRSIGTCDISEPLGDLRDLGLVASGPASR